MGNVKIVFSEGRKEHFQGGDHREQASNRLFISFCCWFLENLTPSTQLSLVCMYSEADSSEWLASYVNSGCKQFSLVVDPHSIQYYTTAPTSLRRRRRNSSNGLRTCAKTAMCCCMFVRRFCRRRCRCRRRTPHTTLHVHAYRNGAKLVVFSY